MNTKYKFNLLSTPEKNERENVFGTPPLLKNNERAALTPPAAFLKKMPHVLTSKHAVHRSKECKLFVSNLDVVSEEKLLRLFSLLKCQNVCIKRKFGRVSHCLGVVQMNSTRRQRQQI